MSLSAARGTRGLVAVKRLVYVKADRSSQQRSGRDHSRATDRPGYRDQNIDDLLDTRARRQRRSDDRLVGRAGPIAGDQRSKPKQWAHLLVAAYTADSDVALREHRRDEPVVTYCQPAQRLLVVSHGSIKSNVPSVRAPHPNGMKSGLPPCRRPFVD
jgi:hypothetical protein